jgi:hypothetical protein
MNKHVEPFEPRLPCLSCVMQDVLREELTRLPHYAEDKGPTITLESRYGEPHELQCLAFLVGALGPLRHVVDRMWFNSKCGHITITVNSSSIFLAMVSAKRLDGALLAYNAADGVLGHAGLTVRFNEEDLACV